MNLNQKMILGVLVLGVSFVFGANDGHAKCHVACLKKVSYQKSRIYLKPSFTTEGIPSSYKSMQTGAKIGTCAPMPVLADCKRTYPVECGPGTSCRPTVLLKALSKE